MVPNTPKKTFDSPEQRREAIIQSAFLCLSEEGYAKLTARKVAQRAKMSLGNITYHFKDMNELLIETYRYASRTLYEATRHSLQGRANSAKEQLEIFLRSGFSEPFLAHSYLSVRIDLWSASLFHPDIARAEAQLYAAYKERLNVILEGVAAEYSAPLTRLAPLSTALMAMLDGLWLDWQRSKDPASIEHGIRACLDLVTLYLAAA